MTATDGSTYLAVTTLTIVGFVVFYAWLALGLSGVFRKSGEEAWQAWVPVLNLVVLLRLGGLSGWLLLLALIPFVGPVAVWVVVVIACHRIGQAFGFGPGMTVLAALLLPVWASVIGFGVSRWVGAEAPAGARRTPVEIDHDGLAFLAGISDDGEHEPTPPAPLRRRTNGGAGTGATTGAQPVPPPLPPVPAEGWVPPPPPPLPLAAAPAMPAAPAAPAAASALPPIPPKPSYTPMPDDRWEGLHDADELTSDVTGASPGAPGPISAVPVAPQPDDDLAPRSSRASLAAAQASDVPSPPVTHVPAPAPAAQADEPWAPLRSPMADAGGFAETSSAVSAIVGAPDAGAPRAARASVSALHAKPEIPEDSIEETVIASRRRSAWSLIPPAGAPVSLSADVVILGRRPVADPDFPGAQLVAIADGTVSKTHARLELRDDAWYITDLGSTNGVLFATLMGTEVEATPGVAVEAGESFLLGDAEVRLQRSEA